MKCANHVSAARLFVQLAPASRPSHVALDFLLPRAPTAAAVFARPRRAFRNGARLETNAARRIDNPTLVGGICGAGGSTTTRRLRSANTAASRRHYTRTAYNPQKDEDGNEMKLEITPRAAKRLADIMRKDTNPNLALRIQVESGGCHGFQYLISLVSIPPTTLSTGDAAPPPPPPDEKGQEGGGAEAGGEVREDDTIFTYAPDEGAEVDLASAPKIILDGPSLELLRGSKVDYTMELIGSQFKIVDNPRAQSSCGCGSSFDIAGF